jgi:hypothetical protein
MVKKPEIGAADIVSLDPTHSRQTTPKEIIFFQNTVFSPNDQLRGRDGKMVWF